MEQPPVHRSIPQLVLGLLIVTVGALLTLDRMGILDAGDFMRYWPAGLIAVGLAKLLQSRGSHGTAAGGLILTLAGAWLLLDNLRVIRVSFREMWPIALVLIGGSLVWRSLRGPRPAPSDNNSVVSAVAILGGVARGNNSESFRGGDLTAIMGGCEMDLRHAKIHGEAVIDVFAMWGGIEIRVPDDWTVVSRVTPMLGGFEDKTRPTPDASTHRLIVRGMVIMGGVEVKN